MDMTPVDVTSHPYLSGRFAPVADEIEISDLEVEGTIPEGLVGAYLRNGPNPMFAPLGSYTFPMEGDAMVHGVWFDGEGGARYKNRWVRTRGMAADIAAGKDVFGGLMSPAFVDPATLGPDQDPGWPFRLDPFINVVRHAGRYLALTETKPCYEITPTLETVGFFDYGGKVTGLSAHPKIDPVTGEMVQFAYDLEAPFLSWTLIGPDGRVTSGPTAIDGVDEGYMIHDCAITERYLVLVVAPVIFDMDAMTNGGDVLAWKPEMGTRIVCVPRPEERCSGSTPMRSGCGTSATPTTTATTWWSTSPGGAASIWSRTRTAPVPSPGRGSRRAPVGSSSTTWTTA